MAEWRAPRRRRWPEARAPQRYRAMDWGRGSLTSASRLWATMCCVKLWLARTKPASAGSAAEEPAVGFRLRLLGCRGLESSGADLLGFCVGCFSIGMDWLKGGRWMPTRESKTEGESPLGKKCGNADLSIEGASETADGLRDRGSAPIESG